MTSNPDSADPKREPSKGRGRRLVPSAAVLLVALLASLAVHLPIYAGLGELARYFAGQAPPVPAGPIEVSFVGGEPLASTPTLAPEDEPPRPVADEPAAPAPLPATPPPPSPTPRPEEPTPEPPAPAVPEPTRPAPPPELDQRRAVVQRSADPTVQSPEDARFVADEANDVEEETVATVTNTLEDQPDPTAAQPEPTPSESEEEGNDTEELAADLRDQEGRDERRVTVPESERPPDPSPERRPPSTSSRPTVAGAESLEEGRAPTPHEGPRRRSVEGGAQARGGGEAYDEVVVSDGFGSYTVRVPREVPSGTGPGEAGGERIAGVGRDAAGDASTQRTRRGGAREGSGSRARGAVQLGLSWTQFESVYGEEELAQERQARLEERRSRARGAGHRARFEQFRAALENYVSEVRPGNQTALDAAASPFATFLSDMHRRIHGQFADRYLASLPMDAPEGQNDPTLATTLEIAVNPDGTVHRVGIVATSGNILFDFGAYNAVMRAQPFPSPPSIILSGDGHAWLHWRFDRGPRQCGTWNAEPFMLENEPMIDRGEPPARDG